MDPVPEVLQDITSAFADVPRPAHFTDHEHCCECAEHDETLRVHDPDTIAIAQLSPAWDPICFATIEGYLYYVPGLARLALGTGDAYYLDQFLSNLRSDRMSAFNLAQRRAVLRLLEHILGSMLDEIWSSDLHLLDQLISRLRSLEPEEAP